jgi:hypothetical protein
MTLDETRHLEQVMRKVGGILSELDERHKQLTGSYYLKQDAPRSKEHYCRKDEVFIKTEDLAATCTGCQHDDRCYRVGQSAKHVQDRMCPTAAAER